MNEELKAECAELIRKYQCYKYESYKVRCRNALFVKMQPWMTKWIKKICVSWNKRETNEEVLSLSWDAFYYCLESYKWGGNNIPEHFYKYTRYWMLNHYAVKDTVRVPLEEFEEIMKLAEEPATRAFSILAKLHRLKLAVPEKYRVMLDDALLSLHNESVYSNKGKKSKCPGVRSSAYYEIKEIFKSIITTYVLGIKKTK